MIGPKAFFWPARMELFLDRVTRLESQLREHLRSLRYLPNVRDVRVIGGVGVIELHGDGYLDAIGPRLSAALRHHGREVDFVCDAIADVIANQLY